MLASKHNVRSSICRKTEDYKKTDYSNSLKVRRRLTEARGGWKWRVPPAQPDQLSGAAGALKQRAHRPPRRPPGPAGRRAPQARPHPGATGRRDTHPRRAPPRRPPLSPPAPALAPSGERDRGRGGMSGHQPSRHVNGYAARARPARGLASLPPRAALRERWHGVGRGCLAGCVGAGECPRDAVSKLFPPVSRRVPLPLALNFLPPRPGRSRRGASTPRSNGRRGGGGGSQSGGPVGLPDAACATRPAPACEGGRENGGTGCCRGSLVSSGGRAAGLVLAGGL